MDVTSILLSLGTAVVTAPITAFITSWGIWKKARADLENEFSNRFNEKRWDVYTEFTKFLYRNIAGNQNRLNDSTQSVTDADLISLASQIMLVGSDKVVSAYRLWRDSARVKGPGDDATRKKLSNLVVEMRRDLGNKYTNLEFDDLLGSLTSDLNL